MSKYPYQNVPPNHGVYPGHTAANLQDVRPGSCAEAIAGVNLIRKYTDFNIEFVDELIAME